MPGWRTRTPANGPSPRPPRIPRASNGPSPPPPGCTNTAIGGDVPRGPRRRPRGRRGRPPTAHRRGRRARGPDLPGHDRHDHDAVGDHPGGAFALAARDAPYRHPLPGAARAQRPTPWRFAAAGGAPPSSSFRGTPPPPWPPRQGRIRAGGRVPGHHQTPPSAPPTARGSSSVAWPRPASSPGSSNSSTGDHARAACW